MLEVQGLSMSYGKTVVLHDLSFQLAEGESLVIVGPSGSGKTTLVRLLCGLEIPDSGTILCHGRSLLSKKPHQRGIAVCFQASALWPHMTLRQNIAAVDKRHSEESVDFLLNGMELARFADQKPSQVSGGQARRAALARALAADQPIVILDEPLAYLGGPLAEQTAAFLNDWTKERGQTLIWTAHTIDTALIRFDRSLELSTFFG